MPVCSVGLKIDFVPTAAEWTTNMGISLIPKIRIDSVLDISPEMLHKRGISLLLLDLDNTLAPYSGQAPGEELFRWKKSMNDAGIELFIVSNTKTKRAHVFAASFGVSYINKAKKPSSVRIVEAVNRCGKTVDQSALAGDQIFTDVLGANISGVTSIAVKPTNLKNPLMAIRYVLEYPFRIFGKRETVF